MALKKIDVCTNCGCRTPDECDGRTFRLTEKSYRLVCKGFDGEDLDVEQMRYRVVMGHGTSYFTPIVTSAG